MTNYAACIVKVKAELILRKCFICVCVHLFANQRLLEIAPPGTPDPTPYLYDVTYQYVTGLLCLAACANLMVRPAVRASVAKAAKDAGLK